MLAYIKENLLAFKERRFAKRRMAAMLKSHAAVRAEMPELSDLALYKEVLLRTPSIDPSAVDQILWQAEDSVDEWTARGTGKLGFRQLVTFVIMSQYRAAGNVGTVVSLKEIVYARIPENL
jgi:hypothetical protein